MKWGVSVYAGLGMKNLEQYLKKAKKYGAGKVFSSLHIPEASSDLLEEFALILETCSHENLPICVDISPLYFHLIPFNRYPNLAIRLDFGFSDEEIFELSQKYFLVLNTSTLTRFQLNRLTTMGIDFSRILTCHNYYPRPETGLSVPYFQETTKLCKEYGLSVDSFISGTAWKRPPLEEGLPTLEKHRNLPPLLSAQESYALGVDCVLFGDQATEGELESMSMLQEDCWILPVEWNNNNSEEIKNTLHQNRVDSGEGLLRSMSRQSLDSTNIEPYNCIERTKGSVTVDNYLYKRYQGEVQITLKDFKADPRVNVLGKVCDEGVLLEYIKALDKWKFI